ncbi:VanW family protein [Streptomyces sp. NPDC002851]
MRRRIPTVPPVALTGGALAVGAGGLYLAGLLVTGDGIDSGTTVSGVDIGGLSRAEATARLEKELLPSANRPLPVKIGERTAQVDPDRAGLSVDIPATLDEAAHSGADPVTVIGGLFRSGGPVDPVIRTDEDKARSALKKLAAENEQKVRDGSVTFSGGTYKQVTARTGHALDVAAAVDPLRTAYEKRAVAAPQQKTAKAVTLPTHTTEPKVSREETERAVREFARPAMSGPITLKIGDKQLTVGQAALGRHLTMKPQTESNAGDDGDKVRLTPRLDVEGLRADPEVAGPLGELTGEPEEAKLGVEGGKVVALTEGKPGLTVSDKALRKAVLPLLTKTGAAARTGEVAAQVEQPEMTRESVGQLGLKEQMSTFTVNFEPAPYRTTNIGRAAELINGSVVMPGKTWSFNDTVGERTKANGFVEGTMILNDRYFKSQGGGVSAVATTMFNAMFFAGVKPVEYGAHSFYIERYPEGREATVAWGSLDLRFNNDSGNAIYIQAQATDSSITVTFFGTKKYDEIVATKGPRENVKEPAKKKSSSKTCEPQTPMEGFDITVERIFKQDGEEVKREPFRTHYTPRDEVICEKD